MACCLARVEISTFAYLERPARRSRRALAVSRRSHRAAAAAAGTACIHYDPTPTARRLATHIRFQRQQLTYLSVKHNALCEPVRLACGLSTTHRQQCGFATMHSLLCASRKLSELARSLARSLSPRARSSQPSPPGEPLDFFLPFLSSGVSFQRESRLSAGGLPTG